MKATPFSQELLATMLSQILSYLFLPQPPFSQEKQTSKTFSHQATSQLHHQETFHTNCRLLVREDLFCFCIASVVHCFLLFFAPTRSSITQCSSGCTCHGLRRWERQRLEQYSQAVEENSASVAIDARRSTNSRKSHQRYRKLLWQWWFFPWLCGAMSECLVAQAFFPVYHRMHVVGLYLKEGWDRICI